MSAAAPLRLLREAAPAEEIVRRISDGLDGYNAQFLPGFDLAPQPLYLISYDDAGDVRAGLRYVFVLEWTFVEWLWVAEPYRRKGEGSRLLAGAEAEARAAKCRGVYLDTFSFQAPAFYAKHGYAEFGRIENYPGGFDRIWLVKRFA